MVVKTGDHPGDRAQRPVGRDDEARPAFTGRRLAPLVRHGLQRTHDRRPDGHDPAAGATRGVDTLGLSPSRGILLVRRLVILQARDAGVQQQRRDRTPCETRRVTGSAVRRAADGISALPGSVAKTV